MMGVVGLRRTSAIPVRTRRGPRIKRFRDLIADSGDIYNASTAPPTQEQPQHPTTSSSKYRGRPASKQITSSQSRSEWLAAQTGALCSYQLTDKLALESALLERPEEKLSCRSGLRYTEEQLARRRVTRFGLHGRNLGILYHVVLTFTLRDADRLSQPTKTGGDSDETIVDAIGVHVEDLATHAERDLVDLVSSRTCAIHCPSTHHCAQPCTSVRLPKRCRHTLSTDSLHELSTRHGAYTGAMFFVR
ncbi:hypothetical protein BGY98DRAFT_1182323 [Russula aff. rugulosa BPL654]|nr:hypothetical protein BGY98DRAFT_1182323 [Russula aff. rugulosa BPL654]